ncbi:MAG: hypothetical protein OXF31_02780 [Gammaproteobacteria bacterium]|nr:hypothetical protein [Gammaproteobacteria bacterium]
MSLEFDDYRGQVLPFLERNALDQFGSRESWGQMREFALGLLDTST